MTATLDRLVDGTTVPPSLSRMPGKAALIDQCGSDRDAEPAGDVVVATAGQPDGVRWRR
jgi:hypothetical protein